MANTLELKDIATGPVLHVGLELSDKKWVLGFSVDQRIRTKTIAAGDLVALDEEISKAKKHYRLAEEAAVVSVYEAGRDGFWIHRALEERGIFSLVVDSASIEVNRKQRRVKTDRVDVEALLRQLKRYVGGERDALSPVRIPTVAEEDQRRLHRERDRLIKERGSHRTRIQSLLILHGIRVPVDRTLLDKLDGLMSPGGYTLGEEVKAEIRREYERYQLAHRQVLDLERLQRSRVEEASEGALMMVKQLMQLRGVGWVTAWVLTMELFAWRKFNNRRELSACVGLVPSPYSSGDMERTQGISKAGNRRVRTLLIEVAWLWLRYQPNSALTLWYRQRFASAGQRMRRRGIVAVARKLLISLWRYIEHGEIPEGVVLAA